MVASSLRNSMARRNHKERAQPLHRKKLGLLEKHKDYVHRARDYKSKTARIRTLREKAAFKNKDEFYFGMIKGRTVEGIAVGSRGNEALGVDVVKVLKTQDAGWVKVQIARDEKKVERIRKELEVTAPAAERDGEWSAAAELAEVEKLAKMGVVLDPSGSGSSNKRSKGKGKAVAPGGHVVFLEDRGQFDAFDDTPSAPVLAAVEDEAVDLGWEQPLSTKQKGKAKAAAAPEAPGNPGRTPLSAGSEELDEARQTRLDLLTDLSALLGRIRLLRQAEAKLEQTKSLMGKGAARKVREEGFVDDPEAEEDRNGERKRWVTKAFKWKAERKR